MKTLPPGLTEREIELFRPVFMRHPIAQVILFGSRALGTHRPGSDVDLALVPSQNSESTESFWMAAKVAGELDELPLPYMFDVQSIPCISHKPLLDHIQRVGIIIYP